MMRGIGFAALLLGGIGLLACLAGLVVVWVERPVVLSTSLEYLDVADGGLELVEEKATRADELVKRIRATADPIASKILGLGSEAARTPEQARELKRIEEELGKRLNQVDAIAEAAETAV